VQFPAVKRIPDEFRMPDPYFLFDDSPALIGCERDGVHSPVDLFEGPYAFVVSFNSSSKGCIATAFDVVFFTISAFFVRFQDDFSRMKQTRSPQSFGHVVGAGVKDSILAERFAESAKGYVEEKPGEFFFGNLQKAHRGKIVTILIGDFFEEVVFCRQIVAYECHIGVSR
jgi:hypothetical protein